MGCGGSKDTDESAQRNRAGRNTNTNQSQPPDQTSLVAEAENNEEGMDVINNDVTSNGKKSAHSNNISRSNTKTSGSKGTKGRQSNGTSKSNGRPPKRSKVDREPISEKGYKKRIREQLRQATDGKDLEELENAIKAFEKNKLEDNGDLEDAKEKLYYLTLRKEIRDAILRRHPGVLDRAIQNVEESPYQSHLQHYLDRARELRGHLTELDQYRHDILEMDQSTISEIRSYHHPPEGVHETMLSSYLILGYKENNLTEWADVQCLLGRYGKESLIREVKNADTVNMDEDTVTKVKDLQSKYSLEKIRSVSCGAATFYEWNEKMCGKFSKDNTAGRKSAVSKAEPTSPSSSKSRKKNKG